VNRSLLRLLSTILLVYYRLALAYNVKSVRNIVPKALNIVLIWRLWNVHWHFTARVFGHTVQFFHCWAGSWVANTQLRVGPSRRIPWSIIHFPHWKCHRCDTDDLVWHLWYLMEFSNHEKKRFSIHSPRTYSGVVRKYPIWDIIPRSPFVSIKDISRLS